MATAYEDLIQIPDEVHKVATLTHKARKDRSKKPSRPTLEPALGAGSPLSGNGVGPMAVYDGVVRAVYKIDGWIKPTETDIAEVSNRVGRYGFVGHRDHEMEKRYVFADVTEYVPEGGGRNPIRYVNC